MADEEPAPVEALLDPPGRTPLDPQEGSTAAQDAGGELEPEGRVELEIVEVEELTEITGGPGFAAIARRVVAAAVLAALIVALLRVLARRRGESGTFDDGS